MADLIGFLRSTGRPVPQVSPGYWPTFQVSFEGPGLANLHLEVFADRIEVYRLNETLFNVWDEEHEPGQGFSQAFADEIPALTVP